MPRKLAGFVLAFCITVTPCVAQTTTELLQKGIFAQETEGNLDTAILIYRQIVNSAPSQRDLAAQAQYRLAQALLQKGDLTTAAQEFDKLARNYADYRNLVSSLSGQNAKQLAVAVEGPNVFKGFVAPFLATLGAMNFDESKPVRVTAKVVSVQLVNPLGAIMVEDDQKSRYVFATAGAADMMRQQEFTKKTLKPGDTVEIAGVQSVGGQMVERALAGRADVITMDGKILFDRANLKVTTAPPDGATADERKAKLSQIVKLMVKLNVDLEAMRTQYTDNSPQVQEQMKRIALMQLQVAALKKEIDGN